MNFFDELKRRNVFRVGIAYAVASWVLLQIVDLVLENISAPDWVMQVFMLALAIGFPIAVIMAWAFEMTPEGIKREADVDRSESITPGTGRKLDRIIMGFLVLAVVLLLADRFVGVKGSGSSSPQATLEGGPGSISESNPEVTGAASDQKMNLTPDTVVKTPSLAVLPFVNMSADPDNEYFSDGISEELLNLLVQVDGLRVPSRTSSFAFKGMNMDIREIAQKLAVDHILEGSVRKAGNQVRITAQLIDVKTDTHLWSNTYDRELKNIFAIQDEISQEIVRELKIALDTSGLVSRDQSRPTDDMQAYQDYLRGRHLFMQRGVASLKASVENLQSAVARDPGFVEAWAALSQSAITLSGWDAGNSAETDQIGLDAGNRALQLDSDSATAMASLGLLYYNQARWQQSLRMFEQAALLSHDSTQIYWHGLVLQSAGYLNEALEKLTLAEQLDPVYPQLQYWIGLNEMQRGDTDQAKIRFQRTIDGGNPNGTRGMFWLHLHENDPLAAVQRIQEMRKLADAGHMAGLAAESDQIISAALFDPSRREDAVRAGRNEGWPEVLAWLNAWQQIINYQQEWLAQGRTNSIGIQLGSFLWAPEFEPLRQMPEFKQLLRDINLVTLWQTRGWPDLCQPIGEDDFECE